MKRPLGFDAVRALAFAGAIASAPAFAQQPPEAGSALPAPPSASPSPPLAERSSSGSPRAPRNAPPRFRRVPPSEPYRASFALAATALFDMAPKPAPGATLAAAFEINPGGLYSPLWRLSLTHAQRRGLEQRGGDVGFAFTLPTLDACPLRLGPRALSVRPCVYGSVGQVLAWGNGSRRSETRSLLYGAVGLATLVSWRVSEAFELVGDARLGVPFHRDQFAFDGTVFFKTPPAGFAVGLGAAWGFSP